MEAWRFAGPVWGNGPEIGPWEILGELLKFPPRLGERTRRLDAMCIWPKEGRVQKTVAVLLLAGLAFAGWQFFLKYRIDGLEGLKFQPRDGSAGVASGDVGPPPVTPGSTVRIASFNIQVFGESKLQKPQAMSVLVETVRRFDVVAIQEVRAKSDDILPRFVAQINATGRRYDYVIGPRLGRTSSKEQYAIVFDTATIEVDRSSMYTVDDPDDLLHREPFVAPFRVRGPPPTEAFTFTLVNIHTDPDETKTELDALAEVFRAVRNDGRGEDDVILLGDLNVSENKLGRLGQLPNIAYAIAGVPTNTKGNQTYDNIIFNRVATTEFTGNVGVVDMMREFKLDLQQALEVSDHLPVWAEFSAFEGGQPGRIALQPGNNLR